MLKQFFCKCLSNGSVRNATWVFGTCVQHATQTLSIVGQGIVTEGGKPATLEIGGGKVVPIAWLCHDCYFPPHHNPHKPDCRNCGADRQPTKEPTNFVRSKVRLEPPTAAVAPKAKAPAPTLSANPQTPVAKPKPPSPSPVAPKPTGPTPPLAKALAPTLFQEGGSNGSGGPTPAAQAAAP